MIAAAAASSFCLRLRQSRSLTARRLSASRLVSRSSPTSTARIRRAITRCYNFVLPQTAVKRLLPALLIASLATVAACGSRRPPELFKQKLVILGFDGLDPRLVQKWMDEGRLPNMKQL